MEEELKVINDLEKLLLNDSETNIGNNINVLNGRLKVDKLVEVYVNIASRKLWS